MSTNNNVVTTNAPKSTRPISSALQPVPCFFFRVGRLDFSEVIRQGGSKGMSTL
jgi:hypothetical protein